MCRQPASRATPPKCRRSDLRTYRFRPAAIPTSHSLHRTFGLRLAATSSNRLTTVV